MCDTVIFCTSEDIDCPCGNEIPGAGCENSTGGGAFLSVTSGTNSVLADDMTLTTTGLPPNNLTIFLAEVGTGEVSFGDGVLCVASGSLKIFRFDPMMSNAAGDASVTGIVGISATVFTQPIGVIDPGETYHFQTWYRDLNGPCGNGYNTSNGLTVNWIP